MIIDEKRLFFMALLKGSVRLVAILALLIVIITPIGMVYEYFDFYPQILNEFEYHDYPENYFIRCFLTGFMSLPLLIGICIATFVFFHTLIFMLVWGGWQMKKKFPGFFNFLALIYILIIVLSSSVFLIMSITLGESTYLAVRVFIPPLCNFLLLCGLFFMFRCKIISAISSVKLI